MNPQGVSKFKVLKEILPDVYLIHTSFWFYNVFPLSNNGIVIKVKPEQKDQDQGNQFLIAINAPAMSSELYSDIQSLGAPVKYVIGSDWHHLYMQNWVEKFPQARAVFPGQRAVDKHPPGTFKDDTIILDRFNPKLPDDASEIELIPWVGFLQPDGQSTRKDDKFRAEVSVYHRTSKLLFMFDPVICTTNPLPSMFSWIFSKALGGLYDEKNDPNHTNPLPYKRNFGPGTGFRIGDEVLAHQSAVRLVNCDAENVVLSHGVPEKGALIQSDVKRFLEIVFEPLLKLTPSPQTEAAPSADSASSS